MDPIRKVMEMNIKDFRKGQTVCVLTMYTGRNIEPTMREATVESVGRKYVTLDNGKRYESSGDEYSLTENAVCGERTYLCPDTEYAQMYIERDELRMWFCNASCGSRKYTLGQLRKVKEILGEDSQ